MKKKEKVILAYSGGLDTSVILVWLINKGYDVICYVADIGQKENFQEVEKKALKCGASKVYVEDLNNEFVTDFIFPAIRGNAIYEGRYLLGTALARPLIAKRHIEIAVHEKASYVAHGATGKGNDQVRFEFTFYALCPTIKVIAPWKMPEFLNEFKGRTDMIEYAKKHKIPIKATAQQPYSEDGNLLHLSHEAGILEDPMLRPTENMFEYSISPMDAPNKETIIDITFKNGNPVKVKNLNDGTSRRRPLDMFIYLNKLGAENGIGRIDIVENRYIGIKSRGVYETPGGTILRAAHLDIEGIAMDKEVMHLRDSLIPKFSELIYNGYWFSPEMDFLMSAFDQSQRLIDGTVRLALYKGNVINIGRTSPTSLYNKDLSSMDVEGGFNQVDSAGFIKINSLRLQAHNVILKKKLKTYKPRGGVNE
jgi:argininosuccinate synthase